MSRKKIEGCCSVEGCDKPLKAKGLCSNHYQMNRKQGRTHRILRFYEKDQLCAEPGCFKVVRAFGYCITHYQAARRIGKLHPGKYKRDHPLYSIWWQRRRSNLVCPEWENFWNFVRDVGEKKSPKEYTFERLRSDSLYGPDNFEWRKHLVRQPDETRKAWYARKWQARKAANPGWDNDRTLKKDYGITRDDYNRMRDRQGNVCAICRKPEIKISHRTGNIQKLAIDHCHKTKKIRDLLCERCNTTLGKVQDSSELLREMANYLDRHSQPKENHT